MILLVWDLMGSQNSRVRGLPWDKEMIVSKSGCMSFVAPGWLSWKGIILASRTQFSGRYQESRLAPVFLQGRSKELGASGKTLPPILLEFQHWGGGGGEVVSLTNIWGRPHHDYFQQHFPLKRNCCECFPYGSWCDIYSWLENNSSREKLHSIFMAFISQSCGIQSDKQYWLLTKPWNILRVATRQLVLICSIKKRRFSSY